MPKALWSSARRYAAIAAVFILAVLPAQSQVRFFKDRASFNAALSGFLTVDDFESYSPVDIATGGRRGDFLYTSDPNITQPAIVPGGNGGQALGGSPFDVFVGGDVATLDFRSTSLPAGSLLGAFGADFLYAPSFDAIAGDTYRLSIGDGNAAGQFAGNLDGLDGSGGTFFLGIIAEPSALFSQVNLYSVQIDPNTLVPAYQIDNLAYAAVPEPSAIFGLVLGGIVLMTRLRRSRPHAH
jgi:hypothetical protein